MIASTRGPLALSALTVLDASPPETAVAAAAAGFDHLGVRVFPAGDEPAWPMVAAGPGQDATPMLRETRRRLDDCGISAWDVEVLRIRPDKDPDEALRILDAGAALGARYVLVNCNDPEPARLAERLDEVARAAAERGVVPAVEFMVFTEVRTLARARELVEQVDAPCVVLPDSLHLARCGSGLDELAALPPELLGYAQLCDTRRLPAPVDDRAALLEARTGRVLPGDGDLPLADFVRALPDGLPLAVEAPVRGLPLEERCRRAFQTLESCLPPG